MKRHNLILFALVGLMSGLASVLLTSRLGSTRPTIAMGWELAVVTMAVLGGVNILGGSGSMVGGDYRRLPDGAGDLRPEPAQRARHCDVGDYRRDADRGDFAADYYPPGDAAKTDLIAGWHCVYPAYLTVGPRKRSAAGHKNHSN